MSNAEEYKQTRAAMDAIGLGPAVQDDVFQVVAAVLHLGNLTFREAAGSHEGSEVAPGEGQGARAVQCSALAAVRWSWSWSWSCGVPALGVCLPHSLAACIHAGCGPSLPSMSGMCLQHADSPPTSIAAAACDEHLEAAAALLGVDKAALERVLTTRVRQTMEGPITSPLTVKAAAETRDALAKVLYSKLFDWLVERINESIGEDK